MKNAGDELKTLNALNPELDDMAAAAVGNTIDTLGYDSCVFTVAYGATAGAPTSIDYAHKIYESDNSDMSGETLVSNTASSTDPAAASTQEIAEDLSSEIKTGKAIDAIFCGVPFLLKDLVAEYSGAPFHEGSSAVKGYVSKVDSELVKRQKAAHPLQ